MKQITKLFQILKGIAFFSVIAFSANLAVAEPITVVSWGGTYGKSTGHGSLQ